MGRPILASIVVLTVSARVFAQTDSSEREALQGKWQVDSYYRNGEQVNAPPLDSAVFAANRVILTLKSNPVGERTFTLDPDQSPRHIDAVRDADPADVWQGIYAIEDDSLLWCYSEVGVDRPDEFTTAADDGRTMIVFSRGNGGGGGGGGGGESAGTGNMTRAIMFVLGSLAALSIWRVFWGAINNRLTSLQRFLVRADIMPSASELRRMSTGAGVDSWLRRFHGKLRSLFWRSTMLPGLAMIVGIALVRDTGLRYELQNVVFAVFAVLAVLLRMLSYRARVSVLTAGIQSDNTSDAFKLLYLLELPRSRMIYRGELVIMIAAAILFWNYLPRELWDQVQSRLQ